VALHTITLLAERITPRIIPLFPFLIAIAHLSFLRVRCLQPQLLTALSPYQGGCEAVRSNQSLEPTAGRYDDRIRFYETVLDVCRARSRQRWLSSVSLGVKVSDTFDLDKWLGEQPGPAGALIRSVHQFWKTGLERKRLGWEVALYVSGAYGTRRVATVYPLGSHLVMISALRDDGLCDTIFAPIEQCAFTISHFQPKKEEKKVIVGFAPQNT
jgi:hypothetical protein